MAAERLSMRKIFEVPRLKHELGLSNRTIARGCSISHSTVSEYLGRYGKAGLTWPPPGELDHAELEARLFPPASKAPPGGRPRPDFAAIHLELRQHRHVTLQLLWMEYKEAHPDGFQYSQFCDLYRRWRGKLDVTLRQDHRAGGKMFVDWAGQTVPIVYRDTGETRPASIFVAVLGASNYAYAEAAAGQDLEALRAGTVSSKLKRCPTAPQRDSGLVLPQADRATFDGLR